MRASSAMLAVLLEMMSASIVAILDSMALILASTATCRGWIVAVSGAEKAASRDISSVNEVRECEDWH